MEYYIWANYDDLEVTFKLWFSKGIPLNPLKSGLGITMGTQNHEIWRFYTPNIWVITPKNEGFGFPWYTKLPRLHVWLWSHTFSAAVVSTHRGMRIYRLRDSSGDGKIDEHDVDTFANCCKHIPGCFKMGPPRSPEKKTSYNLSQMDRFGFL